MEAGKVGRWRGVGSAMAVATKLMETARAVASALAKPEVVMLLLVATRVVTVVVAVAEVAETVGGDSDGGASDELYTFDED